MLRKPWVGTRLTGGKKGSKRHILVDERGAPLSIVVTGANSHDISQLENVLDAVIVKPREETIQNLCADKGYYGEPAHQSITERDIPHVRSRGEEKRAMDDLPGYRPRRWIVEVSHAWFNRFRKILVRYEKTLASYLALHHLAAAIICFRKVGVIYG